MILNIRFEITYSLKLHLVVAHLVSLLAAGAPRSRVEATRHLYGRRRWWGRLLLDELKQVGVFIGNVGLLIGHLALQ